MANNKLKVFSLLLIGLAGLFLTQHGITGLATFDETVRPLCESDIECGSQTCCKFYNADAGICDEAKNCDEIFEISQGNPGPFVLATPEKRDLLLETISGIVVSLLTFSLFIYFLFFETKKARA